MLVQSGRYAEAEGQYLAALQVIEESGGAETGLAGLIHHELGTLYKVLDRLADADASFGKSARAFRHAGEGAEEQLSRAMCEQAEVKTMRTRTQTQTQTQGGAAGTSGDAEEATAERLLGEAKALAEEAVGMLERKSGERPKEGRERKTLADALRSLTQVQMFRKEWSEAEGSIRRSIELLVKSTYQTDAAVVAARMWLSQILLGQEKYREASAVCRALAETHRGTAEEAYFLRYLGEILMDCDEPEEAEEMLLRSLRLCHTIVAPGSSEDEREGGVGVGVGVGGGGVGGERAKDRWVVVNDLVTLYQATGREGAARVLIEEMKEGMRCAAPETTSRFLRTLQCAVRPCGGDKATRPESPHTFLINVLVRERHSKKVPIGSFLVFCFQPPGREEAIPMGLEKQVEPETKTVAVASPSFNDIKPGQVYSIVVRILAKDHETVLSSHTQLVRLEPLSLVLD